MFLEIRTLGLILPFPLFFIIQFQIKILQWMSCRVKQSNYILNLAVLTNMRHTEKTGFKKRTVCHIEQYVSIFTRTLPSVLLLSVTSLV